MSRHLMAASAAWMAACGLVLTFAPREVGAMLGAASQAGTLLPLVLQLLGAIQLGGALTNWMSKGSLVGGIFGRPLAIGNLAHFSIGALALGRTALDGAAIQWPLAALAALYAALALGFYRVAFVQPREASCS
jgi:hypothetical protein